MQRLRVLDFGAIDAGGDSAQLMSVQMALLCTSTLSIVVQVSVSAKLSWHVNYLPQFWHESNDSDRQHWKGEAVSDWISARRGSGEDTCGPCPLGLNVRVVRIHNHSSLDNRLEVDSRQFSPLRQHSLRQAQKRFAKPEASHQKQSLLVVRQIAGAITSAHFHETFLKVGAFVQMNELPALDERAILGRQKCAVHRMLVMGSPYLGSLGLPSAFSGWLVVKFGQKFLVASAQMLGTL